MRTRSSSTRRRAGRRLLLAVVAVTLLSSVLSSPSEAYNAKGPYPTAANNPSTCGHPGRIYYKVTTSLHNYLGGNRNPIWWGDQVWTAQGLGNALRFWNDDAAHDSCNSQIYLDTYRDSSTDTLALVTYGDFTHACPYQSWSNFQNRCAMAFNKAKPFYFGADTPPDNQYSFFGVAAHEFGHWFGLDHSDVGHACDGDYPGSGCNFYSISELSGNYSVMQTELKPKDSNNGSLKCDDIQGFNAARYSYYQNVLANPSFEYSSPFGGAGQCWNFKPGNTNAGSVTRYCGGAQSFSCWAQFNGGGGTGASLRQDMWVNSNVRYFPHVRFWLRNSDCCARWVPATIAVWWLGLNQNVSVSFSVPPDGIWHYYSLDNVSIPNNVYSLRVELYNNSTINLDVDSGMVGSL